MRSIKARYESIKNDPKNSGLSSYTIFFRAIIGQGFSPKMITKWFNTLVDKGDYEQSDKRAILDFLKCQK